MNRYKTEAVHQLLRQESRMNMNAIEVGTVQTFTVARETEHGYVLSKAAEEVMLHINDTAEEIAVNDKVEAFLYQDKQGKIVATTYIPTISFEQYGWCEVVDKVDNLGVFVTIGIPKHILVSYDDLPQSTSLWPEIHDKLYVSLQKDKSNRLIAKPATENVMEREAEPAPQDMLHKPISGHVYRLNPHGSAILTEEGYQGFIHYTERKQEPRLGEWVQGRVIDVKGVGALNISLRPVKEEALGEDASHILQYMENNGGVMPFTDKSSPDDIRETFHISKAAFKRAIGTLMKQKKVKQEEGKTSLISK
ncbi:S1 RNA-binding domain-containing protein [Pontibacillus salicampi]|uniref:S1 RNA-binding domain-containing protein n=1 Tax=Pontibacillus salicampi TaxID=1449801 RepID=A0ABV6LID6_9BACI